VADDAPYRSRWSRWHTSSTHCSVEIGSSSLIFSLSVSFVPRMLTSFERPPDGRALGEWPLVRRLSDAGITEPSTRRGDRLLKSAKGRNRDGGNVRLGDSQRVLGCNVGTT
jgi:hypothetical protein